MQARRVRRRDEQRVRVRFSAMPLSHSAPADRITAHSWQRILRSTHERTLATRVSTSSGPASTSSTLALNSLPLSRRALQRASLVTIGEASTGVETWRVDYNAARPTAA